VISAAGAGMPAVQHEFLGRQARLPRSLVQKRGALGQLIPIGRGLNIDFDDSGIRRHAKIGDARIVRRLIAFENDGLRQRFGRGLHGRHQFQVVLELACRRHEDVQHAVARFLRHRDVRAMPAADSFGSGARSTKDAGRQFACGRRQFVRGRRRLDAACTRAASCSRNCRRMSACRGRAGKLRDGSGACMKG